MKKAISCLLMLTCTMIICRVYDPLTAQAAVTNVCSITFSEGEYTEGASVVGENGWSVANTVREGDSAVVTADPDDAENMVLKITTPAKTAAAATPLYKLAVDDIPNTGILNVSYRIKLKPYETDRAKWAWSDNFGSLDISNSDGTLKRDNTARFIFNGNNGNSDSSTTLNYYAFKDDGTKFTNSLIKTSVPDTYAQVAKTTLYNSWAKVDKHINFDTNEYHFTITYTDMDGTVKAVYTMGTEGTAYSPMYFDGTNPATIGAYEKVNFINFGISPVSDTGVLYVDDIVVSRGYPDCVVAANAGRLGTTSEISLEFSNEVVTSELQEAVSIVNSDKSEVLGAVCTVTAASSTSAVVSISGLDYGTSYTLVLDNSFHDIYGQTMPQPFEYDFTTVTEEDENSVMKVDFENETLYPLNSSIEKSSQWTANLRPLDKATVITDPYNPDNKVLAIEVDNTNLSSASAVELNLGDTPVGGKVQVTYKLRLKDETPFVRYWKDRFGVLWAVMPDGSQNTAAPITFNQSTDKFTYNGYSYSGGTYSLSNKVLGNLENWMQITQRLNLSNVKIKLDAAVLDNYKTPISSSRFGYDGTLYYKNNSNAKFTKVSKLQFSLAPPSVTDNPKFEENAAALGKSILYIDDIEVVNIPSLTVTPEFDIANVNPEETLCVNFSNAVSEEGLEKAFTIKESGSETPIPNKVNITLSKNKKSAEIKVAGDLKFNTGYVLKIDNNFTDSYGETMDYPESIEFTTIYSAHSQITSFDSVVCTKGTETSSMAEADSIAVTARVFNNGGAPETPLVIVAAYNENGRMLGFDAVSGTQIAAGLYSSPIVFNIAITQSGASQIKAFVWRSSSDITLNHLPYVYNR